MISVLSTGFYTLHGSAAASAISAQPSTSTNNCMLYMFFKVVYAGYGSVCVSVIMHQ